MSYPREATAKARSWKSRHVLYLGRGEIFRSNVQKFNRETRKGKVFCSFYRKIEIVNLLTKRIDRTPPLSFDPRAARQTHLSTGSLAAMCRQLEQMKKERIKNGSTGTTTMSSSSPSPPPTNQLGNRGTGCTTVPSNRDSEKIRGNEGNCNYECVALHVSPDLGERVMLSGGRALLDEVFPETTQAVIDARSGVAWHQQDARHVIRFPLNGYCKLNSVQAITRLLNAGFRVVASNGGGVEGQQFSEYLFVRQAVNTWRNTVHQRKTSSRMVRCLQRDHDPEWACPGDICSEDCVHERWTIGVSFSRCERNTEEVIWSYRRFRWDIVTS